MAGIKRFSSCILVLYVASALAAYTVVDDYSPDNFASKLDFFTSTDPMNGYVNYVDYSTASSEVCTALQTTRCTSVSITTIPQVAVDATVLGHPAKTLISMA